MIQNRARLFWSLRAAGVLHQTVAFPAESSTKTFGRGQNLGLHETVRATEGFTNVDSVEVLALTNRQLLSLSQTTLHEVLE